MSANPYAFMFSGSGATPQPEPEPMACDDENGRSVSNRVPGSNPTFKLNFPNNPFAVPAANNSFAAPTTATTTNGAGMLPAAALGRSCFFDENGDDADTTDEEEVEDNNSQTSSQAMFFRPRADSFFPCRSAADLPVRRPTERNRLDYRSPKMRAMSMSSLPNLSAFLFENEDLPKLLPLAPDTGRAECFSLGAVTCDTVASYLTRERLLPEGITLQPVDVRFEDESKEGSMIGAISITASENRKHLRDQLRDLLHDPASRNKVFIFFCEFSQIRGPAVMKLLRDLDREENGRVTLVEMYLMNYGFSAFYSEYPHLCTGKYKPMMELKSTKLMELFHAQCSKCTQCEKKKFNKETLQKLTRSCSRLIFTDDADDEQEDDKGDESFDVDNDSDGDYPSYGSIHKRK